jgi:digeranylgeranylglycerophospholipid reductase
MYDVIVSGAGPAGSKCAEVIAKAGYKVALLEKDINFRKPCGGGLPNPDIYNYYPQLNEINFNKMRGTKIYSNNYRKIKYVMGEDHFGGMPQIVDRLEFDNLVRNTAVKAGAILFDKNMTFDFIYKNQQKVGVKARTPNGQKEYFGSIIIVADGMSSKLANKSGLRKKWKTMDLGIGKAEILEGQSKIKQNFSYFYFKNYGYCWIFPIDNKRFNIGAITYHENNFKHKSNVLLEEFKREEIVRKLLTEDNYKTIWSASFPEPATGILEDSLYGDNIMLIGDAGGFVSPISGEGILPAIISGSVSGKIAIRALKKGDFTSNTLKAFKQHPKIKRMIREFKIQLSFKKFFYGDIGENIEKAFKIAQNDEDFNLSLIKLFMFRNTPPNDFILRIESLEIS